MLQSGVFTQLEIDGSLETLGASLDQCSRFKYLCKKIQTFVHRFVSDWKSANGR